MAAVTPVLVKKKVAHHGSHPLRDGHTGMSLETHQHFLSVRNKMAHYVDQQEAILTEADLHAQPQSSTRQLRLMLENMLVDGGKQPSKPKSKPKAKSATPKSSRKNLAHHGMLTPQPASQHKHHAPVPRAK